ncbi:MAG: hypothetical protein R3E09_07915 [Novosphingobium sp.]|nr:hypothetical protein [Novosphingobium sp.]
MGQSRPTSVSATVWHDHAWNFLCACVASTPADVADRIREANNLFRLAPEALGVSLPHLVEEKAIEALLSSKGSESAALSLLGRETAFMVSRGMSASNLATVVLPGRREEYTAKGATLELALLAAKTAALLAEAEQVLSLQHDDGLPARDWSGREVEKRQG